MESSESKYIIVATSLEFNNNDVSLNMKDARPKKSENKSQGKV